MSGASASIDDLLRHEEEPPGSVRRRDGLRWWVRAAFAAAGFTAVTVFGLRLFGIGVSGPTVFAGILALLVLRRLTRQLTPPPAPRIRLHQADEDDVLYNWAAKDALATSVGRWENKLVWSRGEPERFARAVLPVLGDLADELLRQRHGFTRAGDPARARAVLGDTLWSFLDSPNKRTPTPRELAAVVAQLENL